VLTRVMAVVIANIAFLVNAALLGLFVFYAFHPKDLWMPPGVLVFGVYPAFNIWAICVAALGVADRVASTARALNLVLASFAAVFFIATSAYVPSRAAIIASIFLLAPPALTGWALHLLRLAVAR